MAPTGQNRMQIPHAEHSAESHTSRSNERNKASAGQSGTHPPHCKQDFMLIASIRANLNQQNAKFNFFLVIPVLINHFRKKRAGWTIRRQALNEAGDLAEIRYI